MGINPSMSVDARIASYLTKVSNSVHTAFRSNVAGDAKARPTYLCFLRALELIRVLDDCQVGRYMVVVK